MIYFQILELRDLPNCNYFISKIYQNLFYHHHQIRVFAPKGRTKEAKFAEGMAPYCVQYFEEKIKINYTLPKMGK